MVVDGLLRMMDDRAIQQLERQIDSWRRRGKDDDERKTYDEVFDQQTLLLLAKLMNDGVLTTVDYPVSTGKEGNVFHGTAPDGGALALKIYRVSNATFKNIANYIIGDSRFRKVRRVRKDIIYAWAQKEYKNLLGMAAAGARVPKVIEQRNNILVMSYIGDETQPAPLLREVRLDDPAAGFEDLVESMVAIRKAGLVHGDLSEYNVLVWDGHLWVIDCGQAVPLKHGHAEEWFMRDCTNVARYFKRLGVPTDAASLAERVRGG
jgi:RIO kinase 1